MSKKKREKQKIGEVPEDADVKRRDTRGDNEDGRASAAMRLMKRGRRRKEDKDSTEEFYDQEI